MLRSAGKLLYHMTIDSPRRWYPILAVYYLTYRCSFRCPYCSDGAQNPYYKLKSPTLDAAGVIELLRAIRRHTEYVVITGGEPSQHPDFRGVLAQLPSLGFRGVMLTTNGYDVQSELPLLVRNTSELVFSLDTLDHAKADDWYGVGPGALAQILENMERAHRDPERRCKIVISSVVTPHNIADLYDVFEYAQERGFLFAACPQLVGVKAHEALTSNPEYVKLFDFLIAHKRKGAAVHGTISYLERMRDLRKFECRPFTMLVVSPTGEVFYPCLELGNLTGNLLREPNLHTIRRQAERRYGPQPKCDVRCHSACALGFSTLLSHPQSVLSEGYYQARAWLSR